MNVNGIRNGILVDEDIYCVSHFCKCLVKININNWKVKHICDLNWDSVCTSIQIIRFQDEIFMIPSHKVEILSYNLKSQKLSSFKYYSNRENLCAKIINETIWLFPKNSNDDIICFSITSKEFFKYESWVNKILEKNVPKRIRSYCFTENKLIMVMQNSNYLLVFDYIKEEVELKKLEIDDCLFGISAIDNNYYISSAQKKVIYIYDSVNENIRVIKNQTLEGFYIRVICINNFALLSDGKNIDLCINEKIENSNLADFEIEKGSPFMDFVIKDKFAYLLPYNADSVLKIDLQNRNMKLFDFKIDEKEVIKIFKYYDEKNIGIKKFIAYTKNIVKKETNHKYSVGSSIYEYLRESE